MFSGHIHRKNDTGRQVWAPKKCTQKSEAKILKLVIFSESRSSSSYNLLDFYSYCQ